MQNDSDSLQRKERNIFLRILFAILFFIPFYYVTSAIVGAVVGGIAGAHTDSYAQGAAAGEPAVVNFFNKYDLIISGCQILVYAVLCLLRWVPGVGKYKRGKL